MKSLKFDFSFARRALISIEIHLSPTFLPVGHKHSRLIPYGEKINDVNVSIDINSLREIILLARRALTLKVDPLRGKDK